jgi:DNA polymerase-3 subunit delta'
VNRHRRCRCDEPQRRQLPAQTLEEPLARNHLVLCTSSPDRLLPTIRSRTQTVRFRPLQVAELVELARRHDIPAARAEIAATLADGSAARCSPPRRRRTAVPRADAGGAARGGQPPGHRAGVRLRRRPGERQAGKAGKDDLGRLLDLTARLYRDAIALAAGAPELAVLRDTDGAGGAQRWRRWASSA